MAEVIPGERPATAETPCREGEEAMATSDERPVMVVTYSKKRGNMKISDEKNQVIENAHGSVSHHQFHCAPWQGMSMSQELNKGRNQERGLEEDNLPTPGWSAVEMRTTPLHQSQRWNTMMATDGKRSPARSSGDRTTDPAKNEEKSLPHSDDRHPWSTPPQAPSPSADSAYVLDTGQTNVDER
ncbi:hypothetical protein J5N97_020268 [Dioscorea zingiberensis]|uniref:Uncharacterized protein n=1 Tax=Dioscorea zingiberensis TaxID=325984 RepID=A0A9D5CG24_9LILI|nr:hypothetical protein J5N97_020268 [Dioscorea zingiberensis]